MIDNATSNPNVACALPTPEQDCELRHDWNGEIGLGYTVLAAVAGAAGIEPIELIDAGYPPLYEAVDVDALERLFTPGLHREPTGATRRTVLSFHYVGYRVEVTGDGRVTVVADR